MAEKALHPMASAMLVMADIKAAVDGFNDGEANVCEALDVIIVVVEAYREAASPLRKAA